MDVSEFVDYAEGLWFRGKALMDPEQSFVEGGGSDGNIARLPKAFADRGIPYRDYAVGGREWCRMIEASR